MPSRCASLRSFSVSGSESSIGIVISFLIDGELRNCTLIYSSTATRRTRNLTPDPSPIAHPSNRERGAPTRFIARTSSLPPLPGDGWAMGEGGRGGEVLPILRHDPPVPTPRPLLLMATSSVCFSFMAFAAKLAAERLSGSEIAFLRFAFMLIPVVLIPKLARKAVEFQRIDLLLYRGIFGGSAVLFYFLALAHIPVG